MRQEGQKCPNCGLTERCQCDGELGSQPGRILSLLPPLAEEEFDVEFTPDEGTPLLRELKTEIMAAGLLRREARPLLEGARAVEQLIEAGRLEEADLALQRVLSFPNRPARPRLRLRFVFFALVPLIWYVIQALAAGYTSVQN